MIEDYENEQRKQISIRRSIADFGMGIIFFCFGLYFLVYNKLGWSFFNRKSAPIDYLIGILFTLYGGWRIYRGYRKNYFK